MWLPNVGHRHQQSSINHTPSWLMDDHKKQSIHTTYHRLKAVMRDVGKITSSFQEKAKIFRLCSWSFFVSRKATQNCAIILIHSMAGFDFCVWSRQFGLNTCTTCHKLLNFSLWCSITSSLDVLTRKRLTCQCDTGTISLLTQCLLDRKFRSLNQNDANM